MYFVRILYACLCISYFFKKCMHVWQKIHALLSNMHAFLISAYKMHINFNCSVCLFYYQNQHNSLVVSILTFLH